MSELIEVLTKDGSYSLRSVFFQENFHSLLGALEETKSKFTATSNLQRFKGKSLNVLDICFGLGYNSASLLDELIKQKSFLNLYALEIDKKPLEYSLRNESFLKLWTPKVKKIFASLYRKNYFEDQFFKCNVLWGDAREKINIIPSSIKFDLCLVNSFNKEAELYPKPKHISKTLIDLPLNLCKFEGAVNFNFVSVNAPIKLWKFS